MSLSGNIWGDDGHLPEREHLPHSCLPVSRPASMHTERPCTVTACFTLPATLVVTCAPLVSCSLPTSAP